MKKLLILPMALMLFSCGGANKTAENAANETKTEEVAVSDEHNARNSLSYLGRYEGVTPAASSPGIKIEILLPDDSIYIFTSAHLEHPETKETVTGTYTWNKAGNTITLQGLKEQPNQFFVAEGRLIMRDMEGNEITGELAENYQLAQIETIEY